MVTHLKLYWLQSGKGWGRDKIICKNSTTSKWILHFTCIFIQFFSYSQWEMIMINKFQLLKLFDNTIIINKGIILSTKLYYSNKFQHSTVDLEYCQNEKHFKSPDNLMTTDVNFFQKMRYLFTFSYLKQEVIKLVFLLRRIDYQSLYVVHYMMYYWLQDSVKYNYALTCFLFLLVNSTKTS